MPLYLWENRNILNNTTSLRSEPNVNMNQWTVRHVHGAEGKLKKNCIYMLICFAIPTDTYVEFTALPAGIVPVILRPVCFWQKRDFKTITTAWCDINCWLFLSDFFFGGFFFSLSIFGKHYTHLGISFSLAALQPCSPGWVLIQLATFLFTFSLYFFFSLLSFNFDGGICVTHMRIYTSNKGQNALP